MPVVPAAPAPTNVTITRSTLTSFTVSWSVAMSDNLDRIITGYTLQHQQVALIDTEEIDVDVLDPGLHVEYTIDQLPPEENFYAVKVTLVSLAPLHKICV